MIIFLTACITGHAEAEKYKPDDTFTVNKPFILFNFDDKAPVNNIGGSYGAFDLNPYDRQAYCRISLKKDNDLHKKGYYLKATYDVESDQPAFNGLWTKLNGLNLSQFEGISLKIKGDKEKGFSDFFKIELKDKENKLQADIEEITSQWKTFVIPFHEFEGDLEQFNFADLNEFTMVFEDWRLKTKSGRFFIDDISFIPKSGKSVKYKELLPEKPVENNNKAIKMVVQEKENEVLVNIIEDEKYLFDKGTSTISDKGREVLDKVIKVVNKDSYKRIIIMMFAGRSKKDNETASEIKARAVFDYLIKKGIDYKKLEYRIIAEGKDKRKNYKCDVLIIRWKEGEEEKFKTHFFNGMDAFIKEGYTQAINEWNKALKIDPDNKDLKQRIDQAKNALVKK